MVIPCKGLFLPLALKTGAMDAVTEAEPHLLLLVLVLARVAELDDRRPVELPSLLLNSLLLLVLVREERERCAWSPS